MCQDFSQVPEAILLLLMLKLVSGLFIFIFLKYPR